MEETNDCILNDNISNIVEEIISEQYYQYEEETSTTTATTITGVVALPSPPLPSHALLCYTQQDIFLLAKTSDQKLCFEMNQESLFDSMKAIARPIQGTHAFYICPENQWNIKIYHFFQSTNAFFYIGPMLSETSNETYAENMLSNLKNEIIRTLDDLYNCQAITKKQYESMTTCKKSSVFQVNKLNFILGSRQNQIFLQPTITCSAEEATKSIADFVNHLLQPYIKDKILQSYTYFTTGYEFLRALEEYTEQGHLQSTTRFVKMDFHDLYTKLPHELLIEALEKFLHESTTNCNGNHIKHTTNTTITITTIVRLVRLILNNQFCVYENNLYEQWIGGSNTSLLINSLIDIYLFNLLNDLRMILIEKNEFFGQSFNSIIFTWNDPIDELHSLLNQTHLQQHLTTISIPMTMSIDRKMQYLDVKISFEQDMLQTTVYHDDTFEPEALPYIYKTTHIRSHVQFLRAAYIRAFLYCSTCIEFEAERMYIECSFQNNGLSFNCMEEIFQNLFIEFNLHGTTTNDRTFINDDIYHLLRMRIQRYQQRQIRNRQRRRQRRHQ